MGSRPITEKWLPSCATWPPFPKQESRQDAGMNNFENVVSKLREDYKPIYKLSEPRAMEVKDLVVIQTICQWWTIQCVMKILVAHSPELAFDEVKRRALVFSATATDLARIHHLHSDVRPITALIGWQCEIRRVSAELERRNKKNRIGQEAIRLILKKPLAMERLCVLLGVQNIPTYRPAKYDSEDLQSLAYEKFSRHYRHVVDATRVTLPDKPPPFPPDLGLPTQDFFPEMFAKTLEEALQHLVPNIAGGMELARAKVKQGLKDLWKEWEAQKRTGEEVPLQEADQTDLKRSGAGKWRNSGQIIEQENKPDISEKMFEVFKVVKENKRWGAKALTALKYYLEGKTEKEAAELVGITDKTFRNYITYIKKRFASKK
jgi:hypothetical protein